MPERRSAAATMFGQVRFQPGGLRGVVVACDGRAVGIEHHDMPAADIERVVALVARTRRSAEVIEIAGRARGEVLVVADHRPPDRAEAAEALVERGAEV